jgi:hypothetical protein
VLLLRSMARRDVSSSARRSRSVAMLDLMRLLKQRSDDEEAARLVALQKEHASNHPMQARARRCRGVALQPCCATRARATCRRVVLLLHPL